MSMGTKMGASRAHLAMALPMKKLMQAARIRKQTISGMPEKPVSLRNAAPLIDRNMSR